MTTGFVYWSTEENFKKSSVERVFLAVFNPSELIRVLYYSICHRDLIKYSNAKFEKNQLKVDEDYWKGDTGETFSYDFDNEVTRINGKSSNDQEHRIVYRVGVIIPTFYR